jgi:hypothetical protein
VTESTKTPPAAVPGAKPGPRKCPLCLANPADTREDVLPQWARKRIRKLGVYKGNQVPSLLLPLCGDCNGTFGRRYENETAPILGPMTDGESRLLSPSDQEIIGRWIIKTLLLGALDPGVAVPAAQRRQIRRLCCEMRDHGTPPHQSFVRLAAFDPDQPVDTDGHDALHRNGYLPTLLARATQLMGHLAWEVAVGAPREMERFVASCQDNESLIRIWPPQLVSVSWPPPVKLVYRDILTLRLAWNERRWPPSEDGLLPSPLSSPKVGLIVGLYQPGRRA